MTGVPPVTAAAWVPFSAAEISLLFTLGLLRRAASSRRLHLMSWSAALAFFTVGAGALWYGSAFGWSDVTFRLYYVFGALLGVPWLALGQLQLLVSRRAGETALLLTAGYCVVAAYVVGLVPFTGGAHVHGAALPDGRLLYGALPRTLVGVSNGVGSLVLVVGVLYSILRQWRGGAAARSRVAGLALILAGAVAAGAGGTLTFLGQVSANAIGILIGVSVMYAGFVQTSRRVGRHRSA
ncbi:MAG: hypothetical protein ACYDB7_01635 [Mycobacteriales bacterium]